MTHTVHRYYYTTEMTESKYPKWIFMDIAVIFVFLPKPESFSGGLLTKTSDNDNIFLHGFTAISYSRHPGWRK